MEQSESAAIAEPPPRLAAIDIGTNSIRLVVAEALAGGGYRVLDEERFAARLGANLGSTGRIDLASIDKAVVALRHMKQIADGRQANLIRTIATCAVREAANGREFCRRVQKETGLAVEVVSARQEALLAFTSVQRSFNLGDKPIAVIDIGGGSTEVVLALGSMVEAVYGTHLGAVRLVEMFGGNLAGAEFKKLNKAIDRHLRQRIRRPVFFPHAIYGSGGTFTSLASMLMAAKGQPDASPRGYRVTRAEVRHLLDRLRHMPLKDRTAVPGLSPDRADLIVPGLAIVDRVMDRLDVNVLHVHNRGVRDGLLLSMIDELPGRGADRPVDRQAAVEQLATRCGVEPAHARHVARLSGDIFDQLAGPFKLDPQDRTLLAAAARLQDVGYLIDYEQHHKHSYHLIVNSRLDGFAPHELELIANVARYHRGARPKRRHEYFARLDEAERLRVRRLAGILRIAGGLDRSNTQQAQEVLVRLTSGQTHIQVTADQPADVDLWGAHRSARLFEKAFDTRAIITWTKASGDSPTAPARRARAKDRRARAAHTGGNRRPK